MGWSRIGFARLPTVVEVATPVDKPKISHIEHATSALPLNTTDQQARRARMRGLREPDESSLRLAAPAGKVPAVAPEEALSEYSADEVATHDGIEAPGLWIVVEDKIYDCTNFADMHPGGESMILQFAGKSCTWQFWKFHNRKHLVSWTPALLIGRVTSPVPNPYKEPPRWITTSRK